MKHNIGATDRSIRMMLGLAILSAIFWLEGSLRWLGLIGLVPLITGLAGWCPAYTVFHISSCPRHTQKTA
jgi:hypothetical protein